MPQYNTLQDAMAAFRAHRALAQDKGIVLPDSYVSYTPTPFRNNSQLAMDAQPTLATTGSAGVPVFLTTMIDPEVYEVLFAPNDGAKILGERKKGTWTDVTAMFPTVESVGETTAYGDYNENGMANVNINFPNRQSFLFQIMKQYGEREMDMVGLAKVNLVSEIDKAAALNLDKYLNYTYFFGVSGLINYGLINDPSLAAPLVPASKGNGGTAWITNGVVTASANEMFTDIQSVFIALVNQNQGNVDAKTKMVLALPPVLEGALTQTNAFGIGAKELISKNFPNLRIETAVQYGALSTANPQGLAGGNLMQLIAETVGGQASGYCSFNEKMRAHAIIKRTSSYVQKVTAGTWGAVIRQPHAFASMQGL